MFRCCVAYARPKVNTVGITGVHKTSERQWTCIYRQVTLLITDMESGYLQLRFNYCEKIGQQLMKVWGFVH